MRRTARALSLAAVAGTVLGALVPAAFAGTVPGSGPSWGTASHSPCPEPGGHGWEGYASKSAPPGAAQPEALDPEALEPGGAEPEALELEGLEPGALEPEVLEPGALEPEALEPGVPESEALGQEALEEDEVLQPGAGLAEGSELDELELVPDGEIPAPAGTGATESKAMGPRAKDPKPAQPTTVPPNTVKPTPIEPKPTGSKSTHCAPTPPAHQGVHAGGGGAFTDSVPALAAGGLLIAGAFGAAAHRLYRDRTTRTDA